MLICNLKLYYVKNYGPYKTNINFHILIINTLNHFVVVSVLVHYII